MNKRLKYNAYKRIIIVDDHPLMCDALARLTGSALRMFQMEARKRQAIY